jgi:hypothetical protein
VARPATLSDGDAEKRRSEPAKVDASAERGGPVRALRNLFSSLQGNLIVGLDLGSRYLKYVALSKTRGGYQLEDYDCVELRRWLT